ncbi:hypothetical protein MJ904_07395 [Massilia sp. MB5]|uniref:hypothetical protein n=1 Tax=Massilia sp. MB5 TaxID=2919578 RepID=UPI001F0F5496|nr:hypothetical protein [Massilia sp. MB5]UMR31992.1 hypothetical protein MJ904_07395 [Massilia sp. MB5]
MYESEPPTRFTEYHDLFEIVGRYWRAYGGFHELLRSPYTHFALLLTALCSGYWISSPWANDAVSVLPNLLGFGVTGYAIWIGWGDEKLRELLIDLEHDGKGSFYVQISAIFAHFGLVQVLALLLSFLSKALDYELNPKSGLAHALSWVGLPPYSFAYLKPLGSGIGFFSSYTRS